MEGSAEGTGHPAGYTYGYDPAFISYLATRNVAADAAFFALLRCEAIGWKR